MPTAAKVLLSLMCLAIAIGMWFAKPSVAIDDAEDLDAIYPGPWKYLRRMTHSRDGTIKPMARPGILIVMILYLSFLWLT